MVHRPHRRTRVAVLLADAALPATMLTATAQRALDVDSS